MQLFQRVDEREFNSVRNLRSYPMTLTNKFVFSQGGVCQMQVESKRE